MTKKKKTMEGGGGASEFFICFTSRPSSSSSSAPPCSSAMRVSSSKKLMSPGRTRDPAAPSLSASLSRRLKNSGSVKGGQSPMFPATGVAVAGGGGRKKGCAFEAAEPSSPKVTCIGQVRVKSKKKSGKAAAVVRSRSQRGAEASFRRTGGEHERACLPSRNQKWVHQLPLSICEALRGFGSEFNCFLPCGARSACSSSSDSAPASKLGEEKRGGGGEKRSSSSCGAVFARWLMAIQESEEEKGREVVGLVVEERKTMGELGFLVRDREGRGLGLGLEMLGESRETVEKEEEVVIIEKEEEEKDEEGRVSLCIPPKNALLLMRCRSDPVKMAALANRFWSSPAPKVQCEEVDDDEDDEQEEEAGKQDHIEKDEKEAAAIVVAVEQSGEAEEELEMDSDQNQSLVMEEAFQEEMVDPTAKEENAAEETGNEGKEGGIVSQSQNDAEGMEETVLQEEAESCSAERKEKEEEEDMKGAMSCSSSKIDPISKENKQGKRRGGSSKQKERRRHSFSTEKEARRHSFSSEREARRASFSIDKEGRRRWSFSVEKDDTEPKAKPLVRSTSVTLLRGENKEEMSENRETTITQDTQLMVEEEEEERKKEEIKGAESKAEGEVGEKKRRELPDCLLLMMYEPKLSMEVSKETWVCSTDFLRWRSPHQPKARDKMEGGEAKCDEKEKKEVLALPMQDPMNLHLPPQRPPPPAPPTVSVIEEKLQQTVTARPMAPPYEPFVLTRCKSEPPKSSARLAPDACFWKSRHQPIGAAGIGF